MDSGFWTTISSIATTVGIVIVSVSALLALYQLRESAKARALGSFSRVLDDLSAPSAAEARHYVYDLDLPEFEAITPGTDLYATLYKAYQPFDQVGLMVKQSLVPESLVIEMYGEPIVIVWRKLRPFVLAERKRMARPRYQMYFEYLYKRSVTYLRKRYPTEFVRLQQMYPDVKMKDNASVKSAKR